MSKNLRHCMKSMDVNCTKGKILKKTFLSEISKNDCFFDAMYEVINNIYLKRFDLKNMTPAQKMRLKKFAKLMNEIHTCPKKKKIQRKLVNQTGSFI